jgi:hypothetical protein
LSIFRDFTKDEKKNFGFFMGLVEFLMLCIVHLCALRFVQRMEPLLFADENAHFGGYTRSDKREKV